MGPLAIVSARRPLSSSSMDLQATQGIASDLSTSLPVSAEFTLGKYQGQSGSTLCMLTLRHDHLAPAGAFSTPLSWAWLWDLYERRDLKSPLRLVERVDEVFEVFGSNASGTLDAGEMERALRTTGVEVSDESTRRCLLSLGVDLTRGTGVLDRAEFATLLSKIGDQTLLGEIFFSSGLESLDLSLGGTRAYNWISRDSPAHFIVRSLAKAWPEKGVLSTELMMNVEDNPTLCPTKMERWGRVMHRNTDGGFSFDPPPADTTIATAADVAEACQCDPTTTGGFVVRIVSKSGVHLLPLRGVVENHLESRFESFFWLEQDKGSLALVGAAFAVGALSAFVRVGFNFIC